ncbi:MAG: hypothetical protein R3A50_05660 [Saprospiraceae bacterium]
MNTNLVKLLILVGMVPYILACSNKDCRLPENLKELLPIIEQVALEIVANIEEMPFENKFNGVVFDCGKNQMPAYLHRADSLLEDMGIIRVSVNRDSTVTFLLYRESDFFRGEIASKYFIYAQQKLPDPISEDQLYRTCTEKVSDKIWYREVVIWD